MDALYGEGREHIMRGMFGVDEDRQGVGIVIGALLQRVIFFERSSRALHQRFQSSNELRASLRNDRLPLQRSAGGLADIVINAHEITAGIFVTRRHEHLCTVLHRLVLHIAPDTVPIVDRADPAGIGKLDQGQRDVTGTAPDVVCLQSQILLVQLRLCGDDLKCGIAHL